MRLPFLQVAQETLTKARMLGRYARIAEAHAVGIAVMLDAWALEMLDGDGVVREDGPAEVLAAACGWDGDADALMGALIRARVVEMTDAGHPRLPSRARYEAALKGQAARSEKASRAASERWGRKHNAPGMAAASPKQCVVDAKTQTQTQKDPPTEEAASPTAAVAASSEADGLPDVTDDAQPVDERPALELTAQPMPGAEKKQRKPSAGEALYARLEDRRQKACEAEGKPFIPSGWSYSRMNRDLGPIARAETANPEVWKRFQGAWLAFITDEAPGRAAEPWPLDWFWAQRARYSAKALAEAEQAEDAA